MPNAILSSDSWWILKNAFGEHAPEAWVAWKGNWTGKRVKGLKPGNLPADDDCYYCPSFLTGDARTNSNAARVYVLVIDDVGTKIDREAFEALFPLEPSYVVETSLGNFQYGYFIEGGMDPLEYAALRRAMKGSPVWGASDGIDPVHLFRLPQGTNTKINKGFWFFKVRLAARSAARHSPGDIVSGLGLELSGESPQGGGTSAGDEWDYEDGALEELVLLVPNPADLSREDWIGIAHGIAGAGGDFEIFDEFSSRWDGPVDHDETVRVWETLPSDHKARGGRLRERAEAADPDGFARWKSKWGAKKAFEEDALEVEAEASKAPGDTGGDVGIEPVQREVAESIFSVHGERFSFNHDSGCWHHFQGSVWEPLPKSIKAGFKLAERWAKANAGNLRPADFKAVNKANFYDGVENILRQRLVCRQEDFDRNPWLLGTPGGTVDLKTGMLRPAKALDFISRSTAVAPAAGVNCPRWLRFIDEVCKGDRASKEFLQQWLGYCLTGDTTEQMFLFLYGPGGNGKSVLMDTAAWVAGTYFVKPVADLYIKKTGTRHMQEVAMLAGARMVTMSEVPTGAQWDEGRLKDHTGGGRVTANFMRENSFSFVPQFKLTALGNHQPTFPGGINPAIQRRFKMMLMDFVPRVMDRGLEEKLRGEAPGILRWMIEGLCDPAFGWHRTGIAIPDAVTTVTDEYVRDQDIFAGWLGDRVEKKQGVLTGAEPLWKDWIEYRNAQGDHSELHNTNKAFVAEMERRGFVRAKTNAVRGFRGIILKSNAKSAFDD